MTDYPQRLTPQELADRISRGRAEYSALWQPLSKDHLTARPGPQFDWSVKDQIAHLTWWENFSLARITLMLSGEAVNVVDDFNKVNAQLFAQTKDLPLQVVLDAFATNLPKLLGLIATISDERLNTKEGYKANGRSPYEILSGNTFEHYGDHQPDLEHYVASLKA